jgi:hypothetical protein
MPRAAIEHERLRPKVCQPANSPAPRQSELSAHFGRAFTIYKTGYRLEVDMNQKELSASNSNAREDGDQKAEANRRSAESSRAVAEKSRDNAETRRERAEQKRDNAEDSRQVSEADRRVSEEQRRSAEKLRAAAEESRAAAGETRGAAKELRAVVEKAKDVLEEVKQAQKNGEDRIGGGTSIQVQMEQMPGYLAARFIGAGAPGEASKRFESIAEHCKRTNNDKLLIDTNGYDAKVSTIDRFLLGESLQVFALHRIKVAFVSRPEQIDPQKFGMLVARNRGATVETFSDFQSAEEWLLK